MTEIPVQNILFSLKRIKRLPIRPIRLPMLKKPPDFCVNDVIKFSQSPSTHPLSSKRYISPPNNYINRTPRPFNQSNLSAGKLFSSKTHRGIIKPRRRKYERLEIIGKEL